MDLEQLRQQIDEIDAQIVASYEKRMEISRQVAAYKINTGRKVFDKEREKAKLQAVKALTHNEFNSHGIEELFEQIMSMSRKLQYQLLAEQGGLNKLAFIKAEKLEKKARVVFPGAQGAYTQAAMQAYFGQAANSFHVDTFRDAMIAVDEGSADFAVLPIENSTAGIVSEIYDMLVEFETYIVGEQIIRIEHCLMGVPGASMEDIRTVYSHPQSLMQCARYLQEHAKWQRISMNNNAFAAQKAAKDKDKSQAAIAGAYAAETYGLTILERGINDIQSNSTRFIIVCNQKIYLENAGKISICFEVPHESGSLYHMLSHFIYNNLNMCKIESRPIEGRNWEYRFFIDFEGSLADSAVKNALRGLREEARNMKILGNY